MIFDFERFRLATERFENVPRKEKEKVLKRNGVIV